MSDLLLLLYEAAEHAERWPDFLAALTRVTHSDNAALVLHDLVHRSAVAIPYGYEHAEEKRYFEYYARLNPWVPKDDTPPTDGPIVRGEAIVPLSDLRRTEFYADWAKRNNAVHSVMANLKMSDGNLLFLSLNRGEKKGEHPRHLEASLGLLLPHVKRAIYNQEQYARACALLGAVDAAVFIVDRDRRLLDMTPSAERLLKAGTYISRSPRNQLRSIGP